LTNWHSELSSLPRERGMEPPLSALVRRRAALYVGEMVGQSLSARATRIAVRIAAAWRA